MKLRLSPADAGPTVSKRERAVNALVRGFVDGLGGAVTVTAGTARAPRREYVDQGLAGDWAAIGLDVRRAMESGG